MTCQWFSGLTAGIKLVQRFLKYFRFRLFYGHVVSTPENPWGIRYQRQNKSAEIAGGRQDTWAAFRCVSDRYKYTDTDTLAKGISVQFVFIWAHKKIVNY